MQSTTEFSSDQPGRRLPLSRRKRSAFAALTVLMVVVLVEMISYAWLRLEFDSTLADLHKEQARIALTGTTKVSSGDALHPYLGWVLNPEIEQALEFGGRLNPVNSMGFRDKEHDSLKRRPGRLLIAILGGSVAWQMSVYGEQALCDELRRDPKWADREIEIVRIALSGHKQPQQLMGLAYFLSLGAEFDAVVNIDGYNEMALPMEENRPAGVSLAYPRMWHARMQDVLDPRSSSISYRVLRARGSRQQLAQSMCGSWWRWSPTANLLWLCVNRIWQNELFSCELAMQQHEVTKGLGFAAIGPSDGNPGESAAMARCVAIWKDSSIQIDRLCKGAGIPYVHVLQPNQYLAGSKPLSDEERRHAYLEGEPHAVCISRGYPHLIAAGSSLREAGVDFHDLTGLFADIDEPLYVDTCCHYNERGNKLLAQSVGELLRAALRSE